MEKNLLQTLIIYRIGLSAQAQGGTETDWNRLKTTMFNQNGYIFVKLLNGEHH